MVLLRPVNFKALFGEKALPVYSVIVVVFILVGSTLKVDLVWAMADFFNGLDGRAQPAGTAGTFGVWRPLIRNDFSF